MFDRIERIEKIIEYLRITKNNFAVKSGIAPSNFSRMMSGEQSITDKTLHKISEAYPKINIDWLKTGEGEMLKNDYSITQAGDNSILQHGQAGHNLNQTNNSEKVYLEFISGLKSQGKLTEMTLNQLGIAISQTGKALEEISEQRKMIDRLITLIEKEISHK